MFLWICDRCGVDATDGRAEVTVQVVNPDSAGEDPGPAHYDLCPACGSAVMDALRRPGPAGPDGVAGPAEAAAHDE